MAKEKVRNVTAADFDAFVVKLPSGAVDQTATESRFSLELTNFLVNLETQSEQISDVVDAVFEQHSSQRLTMPTVQAFVLRKLGDVVTPTNFKHYQDLVANYVRSNSSPTRKGGGKYSMQKGKGGGFALWSNLSDDGKFVATASAPKVNVQVAVEQVTTDEAADEVDEESVDSDVDSDDESDDEEQAA
jgi:hypothetical protein